jgi:hypothetical protein
MDNREEEDNFSHSQADNSGQRTTQHNCRGQRKVEDIVGIQYKKDGKSLLRRFGSSEGDVVAQC